MNRHPLVFGLVIFLLLLTGFGQESPSDARQPSSSFRSIVKPEGWALPKHGRTNSRKLFVAPDGQPQVNGVYVSEYGRSQPMFLPWYYIKDERLMLYSFRFRISALRMFDVNGKAFRYSAAAIGSHVGASAIATWTDRDGDGRFEEFHWASYPMEDLPIWVKVTSTNNRPEVDR